MYWQDYCSSDIGNIKCDNTMMNNTDPNEAPIEVHIEDQILESTEETVTEEVNKEIELQKELDEQKDKYLRLFAEFDNYKKRTMRESLEVRLTAAKDTIYSLLPVLDDFERAKRAADAEGSTEPFSEGVLLVYQKLFKILEGKGLKAMNSTGELFDAEYHEAITEIPAGSDDMKGKVIDTVEKGYILSDKIIRYAKVVVGK